MATERVCICVNEHEADALQFVYHPSLCRRLSQCSAHVKQLVASGEAAGALIAEDDVKDMYT